MLDVMYELPSRNDVKNCVITREMVEKLSTAEIIFISSNISKSESA